MGSAPTGKRAYHLPSGTITRSGLYAPTTYIVSYWNNIGSAYSISGTVGGVKTGRTQNGWTYYEHKIQGQSAVSISGAGQVDELRLYPEKAQMTTMTYEPLIGVSSICDVNSKILYYEYDELGRLILIRDQDRNIVKKVCYNYWQQAENCNIYYNAAQSGVFTRNNCGAGSTGGSATYTVPAGSYASTISPTDANNKALADVNANGQPYANVVGACTPIPIQITATNSKSVDYNIRFTNVSTGVVYNAIMNRNTFSPYNLISIPAGTYNVQYFPRTTSVSATFRIGVFSQFASGGATFNNVSITATMLASM
jgi:YD repeat-containing protein